MPRRLKIFKKFFGVLGVLGMCVLGWESTSWASGDEEAVPSCVVVVERTSAGAVRLGWSAPAQVFGVEYLNSRGRWVEVGRLVPEGAGTEWALTVPVKRERTVYRVCGTGGCSRAGAWVER